MEGRPSSVGPQAGLLKGRARSRLIDVAQQELTIHRTWIDGVVAACPPDHSSLNRLLQWWALFPKPEGSDGRGKLH